MSQQDLLDTYLIKSNENEDLSSSLKSEDAEGEVFYLKMKGDYLRYKAEVASKDDAAPKQSEYFHPITTWNILVQILYLWCLLFLNCCSYLSQLPELFS